jgi:cytochrome subunit of sulfide dehydrogenase
MLNRRYTALGIAPSMALALGLLLAGSAAAQDLQELIAECESCHGPGGVSTEADVPSLAGKGAAWLREVLNQFDYYERHCPTTTYRHGDRPKTPLNMCNVANTLSDADKQALADYFSNM